jgi:hypothetical protein
MTSPSNCKHRYEDAWQWQLNFTLDRTLAAADEIWLVFDGIDTTGNIYLNEPVPPRAPPTPGADARCFHYLPNTLYGALVFGQQHGFCHQP